MKLTEKQKLFCKEYLIDLNATAAYKRAGYTATGNSAEVSANRLLSNAKIRKYINKKKEERSKRTEITADRVLQEIAHMAFDDIKNYLKFNNIKTENVLGFEEDKINIEIKDSDKIDTRNISEISVGKDGQFKFKLNSKESALALLGKHLKLFTDKVEHSGEIDFNINIDIESDKDD